MVQSHFLIGVIVILFAIFALFYVFNAVNELADRCEAGEELKICEQMSGFTLSMLIVLLVIGGFVLVISTVVYIMLSA
jgi:hypothetical protein